MSFLRRLMASAHPSKPDADIVQVFGGGLESTSGLMVNAETAQAVTAVYACVQVISETLAVLPCPLFERLDPRGKRRATEHPLYRLLTVKPNPWQTPFEFKEMLTGHAALRGVGYAQKVYRNDGTIDQLVPLHPARMVPRWDDRWGVVYDYHRIRGGTRTFLQSELFRVIAHTDDGVTGRSPIAIAKDAVGLSIAAQQFAGRFFQNNAQIAGYLSHPGKLSKEAKQKLRDDWVSRYGGADNAGKMAVLEEGLTWTAVGMKLDDAQFLETRKFQVEEIARLYRIPPHKIQSLDRATFNNIEHLSIEWVMDSVLPWVTRWEQALCRDLLESEGEQDDYYFKFLVDALLRGDQASRSAAYATARQWGWMSANDIRELEDMNPLPDGQGDEYLVPVNMKPAGTPWIGMTPTAARALPASSSTSAVAALLQEPLHRVVRRECQRVREGVQKHGHAGALRFADRFDAEVFRTVDPILRGSLGVAAAAAGADLPESLTTALRGALTDFATKYVKEAITFWQGQIAAELPDFEQVLARREAELPGKLARPLAEACEQLIAGAAIHQSAS